MPTKSPILDLDTTIRLLVDQITDYAIFLLTPSGEVATWNPGAERIKGYKPQEIIGRHFRVFYTPQDQAAGKPEHGLRVAATGRFEDEGWRVRKDGSVFWASVIITAVRDPQGQVLGYGKVTKDLTERRRAEEQLRELSGRLLKLQDEERQRIGRDLHDTVGQHLAMVKMSLDGLASQGPLNEDETRKQLAYCLPTIDRAVREVRTLSYLLYPPMLEETGLSSAIRWHLDEFSKRSGIRTTYETADQARLPRDIELALFRVFQESLTNIHRHSESKTAQIRFAIEPERVFLEIKDQGKGMSSDFSGSKTHPPDTLGVGIRGMHERVRQLGGELQITSTAEGTTVCVTIPLALPSRRVEGSA
jgi:PAS domain S-box-containing protein